MKSESSEEINTMGANGDKLMRQTSSDVKPFKKSETRPAAVQFEDNDVPPDVIQDNYGDYYDLTGDKHLIIFNHFEYKNTVHYRYQTYSKRNGTDKDVESLQKTFGQLGFKVVPYKDLDYEQIMNIISKFCDADHKNTACIAIAILTHGERGGEVCAADRPYPVNDITDMLQRTPGLAGKPKLLFVQACRGQKVDEGHRIQLDGDEVSIVIPSQADCLVLYSSYDEHLSYRDANGSWLIQALCTVVSENYTTLDLLQIVTLVLRQVALRATYIPTRKDMHNKKQMPEARFTLTKFLKFSNFS